jgi:hypothetical protein
MSTATAGRGDPYWYEWFVGLREVIGMIDEGSEITLSRLSTRRSRRLGRRRSQVG